MNEEKIRAVLSDEEFVNSLLELETPEEVQKALEEKDIALSVDEIKEIAKLLQKKTDGELSDEDLENVAGGSVTVAYVVGAFVLTSVVTVFKITRRRW